MKMNEEAQEKTWNNGASKTPCDTCTHASPDDCRDCENLKFQDEAMKFYTKTERVETNDKAHGFDKILVRWAEGHEVIPDGWNEVTEAEAIELIKKARENKKAFDFEVYEKDKVEYAYNMLETRNGVDPTYTLDLFICPMDEEKYNIAYIKSWFIKSVKDGYFIR